MANTELNEDPKVVMNENVDDYSHSTVPLSERKGSWTLLLVWAGWIFYLGGPITGAIISAGFNIWVSLLGILAGNLILALVAFGTGVPGREVSVSLSRLSRISFGSVGTVLVSILFFFTLAGWYGVSIGLFAATLNGVFPSVPKQLVAVLGGIGFFGTAYIGMKVLVVFARFAVPYKVLILVIAIIKAYSDNGLNGINLPGNASPFLVLVGLATAHWITGATIAPDITRWAKDNKAVWFSSFWGFGIANTIFMWIGAVAALILGEGNFLVGMVTVFPSPIWLILSGLGIVAVVWCSADKQCYSASLALANMTGMKLKLAIIITGIVGMLLAVGGIFERLFDFLNFLGTFVSPMAGVIIADYWIINNKKYNLMPEDITVKVNPWAILAVTVGILADYYFGPAQMGFGIPSVNGLTVAALVYIASMKATHFRMF